MKKKITKEQFKKEYAELKEKFKAAKAELKRIRKELAPFCRKADDLFAKGERSLYIEEPGVPVKPAFAALDGMLGDLGEWTMAKDILGDAIREIP